MGAVKFWAKADIQSERHVDSGVGLAIVPQGTGNPASGVFSVPGRTQGRTPCS